MLQLHKYSGLIFMDDIHQPLQLQYIRRPVGRKLAGFTCSCAALHTGDFCDDQANATACPCLVIGYQIVCYTAAGRGNSRPRSDSDTVSVAVRLRSASVLASG